MPLWRLSVHPWFNEWEAAYGVGFGLVGTGIRTALSLALVAGATRLRLFWRT